MFETFNVRGLYIANSAILSLLSAGKFTGIVIESGGDLTHFVPIYDSTVISHAYIYENKKNKFFKINYLILLNYFCLFLCAVKIY